MQMEPDKVHIFLIDEGLGQPAEAPALAIERIERVLVAEGLPEH